MRAAEDDRAARPGRGGRLELGHHPAVTHAEQDQVGGLVERRQVGQARSPGDLGIPRVDQPDLPEAGRPEHLTDHPLAEAARSGARPDDGHGLRLEHRPDGIAQDAGLVPTGVASGEWVIARLSVDRVEFD